MNISEAKISEVKSKSFLFRKIAFGCLFSALFSGILFYSASKMLMKEVTKCAGNSIKWLGNSIADRTGVSESTRQDFLSSLSDAAKEASEGKMSIKMTLKFLHELENPRIFGTLLIMGFQNHFIKSDDVQNNLLVLQFNISLLKKNFQQDSWREFTDSVTEIRDFPYKSPLGLVLKIPDRGLKKSLSEEKFFGAIDIMKDEVGAGAGKTNMDEQKISISNLVKEVIAISKILS
ncbi:MAG: hypothetical protein HQM10_16760 [Candidatus Riflebacteria bacterium]|nr:hypothetical protein [Candidatus Riflebacteria bacterium]